MVRRGCEPIREWEQVGVGRLLTGKGEKTRVTAGQTEGEVR